MSLSLHGGTQFRSRGPTECKEELEIVARFLKREVSAYTYNSLKMVDVKRNRYISEIQYIISFKPHNNGMS